MPKAEINWQSTEIPEKPSIAAASGAPFSPSVAALVAPLVISSEPRISVLAVSLRAICSKNFSSTLPIAEKNTTNADIEISVSADELTASVKLLRSSKIVRLTQKYSPSPSVKRKREAMPTAIAVVSAQRYSIIPKGAEPNSPSPTAIMKNAGLGIDVKIERRQSSR